MYVATTATLCSLYFIVTGLQLWVTAYLKGDPINASLNMIVAAFGATSATGPVLGVILGGIVLDRIGGYQKHLDRATFMGACCGLGALTCALLSLMVTNFWVFIVLIWILLFFGGAVVPVCTGILMTSVEKELRRIASSSATLLFNLFGYFLGPFLCGLLAEIMSLQWGFRLVMSWSIVAFVSLGYAALMARRMAAEERLRGQVPHTAVDLEDVAVEVDGDEYSDPGGDTATPHGSASAAASTRLRQDRPAAATTSKKGSLTSTLNDTYHAGRSVLDSIRQPASEPRPTRLEDNYDDDMRDN